MMMMEINEAGQEESGKIEVYFWPQRAVATQPWQVGDMHRCGLDIF